MDCVILLNALHNVQLMTHFATISVIKGTLWWMLGTKKGGK